MGNGWPALLKIQSSRGSRGGALLGRGPLNSHDTTTGRREPGNLVKISSHVRDNYELCQWIDNGDMVGVSTIVNH